MHQVTLTELRWFSRAVHAGRHWRPVRLTGLLTVAVNTEKDMTDKEQQRMKSLEAWLKWCLDNCDDSPEWNFGTKATENIRALLAGEDIQPPDCDC